MKNIKEKFTREISTVHRERNAESIRKKREEQTKKKRIVSEEINVREIIQQWLNTPTLDLLNKILGSGKNAEPYYAPSKLYPEHSAGPFIFPNDLGIRKLIELFATGDYVAGQCLLHITGHGEVCTWTYKLINNGLVPVLMHHLHNNQHPALCYWMIANMCTDNIKTRDLFISLPEYHCSFAKQTDLEVITEACLAFKTLFDHSPIPPIEAIAPLWINYFQRVNPAEERSQAITYLNEALIIMTVKGNAPYRIWIAREQPQIISRLIESIEFLFFMSNTPETHGALIESRVIPKLVGFLHSVIPHNRIYAATALSYIAASVPFIFHDPTILSMFTTIIANCDIWKVQRFLYFALTTIGLNIDDYSLMVEHQLIYHIYTILASDDTNLLINALYVLRRLFVWNQDLTMEQFDGFDGISRLESLGVRNQNEEIQELVENILDMFVE
jgi:hypothetical protein